MKKLMFLMIVSVLFSCAKKEYADTLVLFMEKEEGVEPYQTRMIITKDFVRIDDGDGDKDFVLFNRNTKVVHSVSAGEKTVMAIHEKKLKKGQKFEPPFKLTHSVKKMPAMKDAPAIEGEKAKHYQLITNDKVCYDVISVKDLMPNVVKALKEFHQHMALDSIVTFNNFPADMQNACDMAATTFKPARQFEFGFPIQEWGMREYSRSLIDYDLNYKADSKLFVLPEGYKNYTVTELREGKVSFSE
ncbi:MAG: hypothetical protein OQK75_05055 [Gammaproteobacteria bacterium]|nr:hypothetical protein [Gammaproteobacteria bacterium]MCW8987023.1 hypothetical protein [Gammaproteobacteria bacterium]MCW9030427.1 hypothetical protein [Gammaproteobacteria bacterium]